MVKANFRLHAGAATLALWGVSLMAPAATECDHPPISGAEVLSIGWMGLLQAQFAWFANPFVLVSAILLLAGKRVWTGVVGLGFLLSLNALGWRETQWDNGPVPLCAWNIGFYLWMLAAAVPVAQALWEYRNTWLVR